MKPAIFETYLMRLHKAAGVLIYQNLFVMSDSGERIDVSRDGELSCALFVTNFLLMFDAIARPSATVATAEKLLESHGWKNIPLSERLAGDVLVWEAQGQARDEQHLHIGFSLGSHRAISNSFTEGFPKIHHDTYDDTRAIIRVWRYGAWETAFTSKG